VHFVLYFSYYYIINCLILIWWFDSIHLFYIIIFIYIYLYLYIYLYIYIYIYKIICTHKMSYLKKILLFTQNRQRYDSNAYLWVAFYFVFLCFHILKILYVSCSLPSVSFFLFLISSFCFSLSSKFYVSKFVLSCTTFINKNENSSSTRFQT